MVAFRYVWSRRSQLTGGFFLAFGFAGIDFVPLAEADLVSAELSVTLRGEFLVHSRGFLSAGKRIMAREAWKQGMGIAAVAGPWLQHFNRAMLPPLRFFAHALLLNFQPRFAHQVAGLFGDLFGEFFFVHFAGCDEAIG